VQIDARYSTELVVGEPKPKPTKRNGHNEQRDPTLEKLREEE